jgi:RimJ/RimL family protein N-acetyltransferase
MLNFRKLEYDDLEFLNEVRNLYAEEFLHDSRKFSLSETQSWFLEHKPDYYIIEEDNNKVGYFRISNHSKINSNLYIGADIHPNYKGKGYGYNSYKEFIPILLKKYNLNKISLEVLSTNKVAIALYQKLGFKLEGIKRQEVMKNGKYIDSMIMSILKEDIIKRTCYIVNFYFGDRRKVVEEYTNDRLFYLKTQIQTLTDYYQNIDKIIFNFNVEKEHYGYLNDALKIIPKQIQNSNVEVNVRENKGLSYGTFSEIAYKEKDNYEYFIFNEDDYFLVQNNWDQYMIRKFNTYPDTGYFCAFKREKDTWNGNRSYAGHCFGITSAEALNLVYEKYGQLPFNSETNNYKAQEEAQIMFSYSFEDVGLKLYDIREEYRLGFGMTEKLDADIWRLFWWNEKDLIVSPILLLNKPYIWWESSDGPFQKRTNLE